MKRMLAVLVLMLLCAVPAWAGNGEIDAYREEFSLEELTEGLDAETLQLLSELGVDEVGFETLFSVTPTRVFEVMFSLFTGSLTQPFSLLLTVTGALALLSLYRSLRQEEETGTLLGSAAALLMIAVPLSGVMAEAFSVFSALSDFTVVFSGIFCGIVSAAGNPVLGVTYNGLTVAVSGVAAKLSGALCRPTVNLMCVLGFVAASGTFQTGERMGALVKKAYIWVLSLFATVFSAFITLKGVLGAGADSVTSRGIRFVIGRSIPVVGGALSESFAAMLASLMLIRSTVGVFGILTVLLLVLPITLKILSWLMCLQLLKIVSEAFGNGRVTGGIAVFSDALLLVWATLLFLVLLFVIAVGVVLLVKGGNS